MSRMGSIPELPKMKFRRPTRQFWPLRSAGRRCKFCCLHTRVVLVGHPFHRIRPPYPAYFSLVDCLPFVHRFFIFREGIAWGLSIPFSFSLLPATIPCDCCNSIAPEPSADHQPPKGFHAILLPRKRIRVGYCPQKSRLRKWELS